MSERYQEFMPTGEVRLPCRGELYMEHDGIIRTAPGDFCHNEWPIYRRLALGEALKIANDQAATIAQMREALEAARSVIRAAHPGHKDIDRTVAKITAALSPPAANAGESKCT